MASAFYNIAKGNLLKGTLDLDGGDDIRARLCMTNTTADTDIDADTVGGITTLDESDDASYAAQALTTEGVTVDDTDDQAEFTSDDITFSLAGDGTRDYQGVLFVEYVDGGTGDIPIMFLEISGQPIAKEVTSITVQQPTDGWFTAS